jgi:deoxyadenosine/deoxycytidine kinase
MNQKAIRVGIVGPCAAGKSTLVSGLKSLGIQAKHIAQEHSYVQDMWKRLTNPDLLVYLDVSYPVTLVRRKLDWSYPEYQEQLRRLNHARSSAQLIIDTDRYTAEEVLGVTLQFIQNLDIP